MGHKQADGYRSTAVLPQTPYVAAFRSMPPMSSPVSQLNLSMLQNGCYMRMTAKRKMERSGNGPSTIAALADAASVIIMMRLAEMLDRREGRTDARITYGSGGGPLTPEAARLRRSASQLCLAAESLLARYDIVYTVIQGL